MVIYFSAFIITLLFCYLANKSTKTVFKNLFMILSMMPFFIISAIRYNVGIDTWLNYTPTFESVALYGDTFEVLPFLRQKYELGFCLIVMMLAKICTNPVILFTFCSAIIMIFTFLAIYEQSKITWLSIVIFFLSGAFLLSMNGMRNYVAMAIVLYSFKYIYNKKLFKFLFIVLIAATIHKSVLLVLILYPLYNIKINKNHIIAILLFSLFLTLFIDKIVAVLFSFTTYKDYFITEQKMVDPLYSMLVINSILLVMFLFNYKENKNDNKYNFFLKLQLLSVIICIFSFKLPMAYRIEQIIDFFQIITIPYNIYLLQKKNNFNKKFTIIVLSFIIVTYSAYFTKVFILSDDNQVKNYVSIFNKE